MAAALLLFAPVSRALARKWSNYFSSEEGVGLCYSSPAETVACSETFVCRDRDGAVCKRCHLSSQESQCALWVSPSLNAARALTAISEGTKAFGHTGRFRSAR